MACLNGFDAQSNGQMGFAHPRRSEEKDIFPTMDKAQRGQFVNDLFGNLWLSLKVKVLQGFVGGDTRESQVSFDTLSRITLMAPPIIGLMDPLQKVI